MPPAELRRNSLDDGVQRLGLAYGGDRRLADDHLGPEPHSVADLGVLVERGFRKNDVALERGLAHENLDRDAEFKVTEHLLDAISVRIAHDRIRRLDE